MGSCSAAILTAKRSAGVALKGENLRIMQVRKHTSERIHPDFETQGRVQKQGYQWTHENDGRKDGTA